MVITPSEAVRRQALDRFHLQPNRVVAVPLAAGANFQPVPSKLAADPPYLLYVGNAGASKKSAAAARLYGGKFAASILSIWCWPEGGAKIFPSHRPNPVCDLRGLTPEEELPKLYSGALAVIYPSYYEGFGLPVLEAMQCGAAVIASSDRAISEVAGDAAILVDVNDRRAWMEALTALVEHPEPSGALRKKALERAAEFSWTKTAQLTREVYGHAIERFRKKT